jgi:hypothetical protein
MDWKSAVHSASAPHLNRCHDIPVKSSSCEILRFRLQASASSYKAICAWTRCDQEHIFSPAKPTQMKPKILLNFLLVFESWELFHAAQFASYTVMWAFHRKFELLRSCDLSSLWPGIILLTIEWISMKLFERNLQGLPLMLRSLFFYNSKVIWPIHWLFSFSRVNYLIFFKIIQEFKKYFNIICYMIETIHYSPALKRNPKKFPP